MNGKWRNYFWPHIYKYSTIYFLNDENKKIHSLNANKIENLLNCRNYKKKTQRNFKKF